VFIAGICFTSPLTPADVRCGQGEFHPTHFKYLASGNHRGMLRVRIGVAGVGSCL